MKIILTTRYNGSSHKRGTFDTDTKVFKRDKTPFIKAGSGKIVTIEPDVVNNLKEMGCEWFDWGIRGDKVRKNIPFSIIPSLPVVFMGGRDQHKLFLSA